MPPTALSTGRLPYCPLGWGIVGMTTHGSARFASQEDLAAAKIMGDWVPGTAPDGLLVGWHRQSDYAFEPITYKGDLHQLIVAGIGGGKFTTALAPMLLGSNLQDQAVVVVDPKGEIARFTGPFFQEPFADRRTVFLLDPWDECGTSATASLTFIAELMGDNPNNVDDARALSEVMIVQSGAENKHWEQTGRELLTALLLHVALDPLEKKRDLMRIREIITLPWTKPKVELAPKAPETAAESKKTKAEPPKERETLFGLMLQYLDGDPAKRADGTIRRTFTAMMNRDERERAGIISTVVRETGWIESPAMRRVLQQPSLDLRQAALGGNKYFLVLPTQYLDSHAAWLRLCIVAFSTAFKRHQPPKDLPQHKRWRHIVIDEFPSLGEMRPVLIDIAVSRGYSVKYHLTIQDLPQLEHTYKTGWETFINNSLVRVFAVNDLRTTKYTSEILGETTVNARSSSRSETTGESQSYSRTTGENTGRSSPNVGLLSGTSSSGSSTGNTYGTSSSFTYSSGVSFSEVKRSLMTPDEVRRLPDTEQIIMMRGMGGILSWRPTFLQIFPSLPDYSLKEAWSTVGRKPVDEAERRRFTRWRDGDLLFKPKPYPVQTLPATPPAPAPKPSLALIIIICAIIAFGGYKIWQSYSESVENEARQTSLAEQEARRKLVAEAEALARLRASEAEASKRAAEAAETRKRAAEAAAREARAKVIKLYEDEVGRRAPGAPFVTQELNRAVAEAVQAVPPPAKDDPIVRQMGEQIGKTTGPVRNRRLAANDEKGMRAVELLEKEEFGKIVPTLHAAARQATEKVWERISADVRGGADAALSRTNAAVSKGRAEAATTQLNAANGVQAASLARRLADETIAEMENAARTAILPLMREALARRQDELEREVRAEMHRLREANVRLLDLDLQLKYQ